MSGADDPSSIPLLDRLSHDHPTAKRQTLRRMIAAGRVRVNGVPASRATQRVTPGDRVEILDQRAPASRREATGTTLIAPLQIVFEDDDVLIVDKPPGLLTSTGPREKRQTALALVRRYVAATSPRSRIGLIHRLDRDASGLLVFSKSGAAYASLKTQFFKHTVDRVYRAIVHGTPTPPSGMIDSRLVERADGSVHSTDRHAAGQRAVTRYQTLESAKGRSLLLVRLETGRKHQIRAHLSERGVPIVGDRMYGRDDGASRLMLCAVELAFDHPRTGRRMTFTLDVLSTL